MHLSLRSYYCPNFRGVDAKKKKKMKKPATHDFGLNCINTQKALVQILGQNTCVFLNLTPLIIFSCKKFLYEASMVDSNGFCFMGFSICCWSLLKKQKPKKKANSYGEYQ